MPNVTWTLEKSFLRGKNQEFESNLELDLKSKIYLRKDKKLWNYI
jgi:hypothetical protein